MKTYEERRVIQIIEEDRPVPKKPQFKIGDYMEIYCGSDEGHCFTIKDVRWNVNRQCFEYKRECWYGSHWLGENTIVRG